MPLNYSEEDQDERTIPPGPRGPAMDEPTYDANIPREIPPLGTPVRVLSPGARSAFWQIQPQSATRSLGIGHRIGAMGQEQASPLGGAFSLGEVGMRPPQRPVASKTGLRLGPREQQIGIGHRILGLNSEPATNWRAGRMQSLPNTKAEEWRSRHGSPNAQPSGAEFLLQPVQSAPGYGSFFSSFGPAGATPRDGQTTSSQLAQSQSGQVAEGLGKAAGGGALATATRQYSPSNSRNTPVVDVSNMVTARSRIQQAKPEVKPNLAIRPNRNDRDQLKKTLRTVMKGMDEPRAPRAVRHMTQDDINEAAAVAYSENTDATVEAYERIISAILNRVRSGDRQFVDPGQPFTVHNVVHSKSHGNQFQGVDRAGQKGRYYRDFANNHTPAAEKARTAAENIAAHGPNHNEKFFVALNRGQSPTEHYRHNLGKQMHQVGPPVDGVFLYEPAPAAHKHQGTARHQHGKAVGPHHPHHSR